MKMTKKQLWESKLAQRGKHLKEAYDDFADAIMRDGTKVYASASTRSTRTYNYEDVEFEFGAKKGRGTYRWMNRPWQKFDFAEALKNAMIDAGVDKEFARECIDKSGSLRSAVEYFAKNYKSEKKEIEESYSKQELLDAVMDAFGFTKSEALEYIKKASEETKRELVKGFKQDAKKNFYDDEIVKEEVEENKTYQIQYWLTEEDRDEGFSDIFIDAFDKKLDATLYAGKMVDRGDVACVEVYETDTNKVVFGYDGARTWSDDDESELEEAQGKKEPGVEFVIFDASEEGKAPILGIRSTRVEAEFFKNKLEKTGKYEHVSFDEVPKGKFKRGDDFWGPFNFDEEEKLEESKQLNEMVIDLILDRKDGMTYSPEDFYRHCMQYKYSGDFDSIVDAITRAMDEGTEEDVKNAICDYIRANDYNEKICDFVNSVTWLEESLKEARGAGKGQKLDKFFRLVGNLHKDNLSKEEIAKLEKAKAEVERFEPTSEYEKKDKKNLLQQIERVLKDDKLEEAIDLDKHVWEGWTVQDFIDELEPLFDQIMSGNSWKKPFKDKAELKAWCIDNQPYYKRYIPGVVEYFFKKMKKNENLNEKLVAYDPAQWEPEDIELHKSINWKERNYEDFAVPEDSFETEVVAYGLKGGPQRKTVKVVKHLRGENPIYPPYYRAIQQPFENVVGPMFNGHKHGKYSIHDRYETQEYYNSMSESKK